MAFALQNGSATTPRMVAVQSRPTPRAEVLPEAERLRILRALMGDKDPSVGAFPAAIRAVTCRDHDRWVKPLYEQHWPDALVGRTDKKLRFLTCNLYATAPYTVLFSSARPPFAVRALRALGVGLGFSPASMATWAGRATGLCAALLSDDTRRRIVQIASFIAAVDHIFDHCMQGMPAEERGRRMRALLDDQWLPDDTVAHAGAFRFLRALFEAMGGNVEGEDAAVYAIATNRLREFFDAEVKAMTGVKDPTGLEWRMPGVLGTIEGLVFPVWRFAGEPARTWMYGVSLFVQVMDDWIDLEKDLAEVRPTPMTTGFWDERALEETWRATVDGIVALAKNSGIDDERYLRFVRETYRFMAIEVAEAMGGGGAA